MHLVSSQFRDGKPVDNHGKELGGYGSAAPTRYRSHALQAPTVTGETTTFVPLGETNNTLRYFAATEIKAHERGWSGLPGAPPWDATPYIHIPYTLRGLRVKSNEPWVNQVGPSPEIDFATSSLSRLDDGQRDTPVRHAVPGPVPVPLQIPSPAPMRSSASIPGSPWLLAHTPTVIAWQSDSATAAHPPVCSSVQPKAYSHCLS